MTITEYADRLVKLYNEAEELRGINFHKDTWEYDVQMCRPFTDHIHIYNGIDKLANELGIEIQYREYDEGYDNLQAYIVYKGVEFMQLVDEKGDFTK